MKILLINQYGTASGAPTGRILHELADGLIDRGHEVVFFHSESSYGKSMRGISRIFNELKAHLSFLWRGLFVGKVDAIISLTSPACLAVTAGAIAALHRAPHFHWAMDIYPDVAVRLGEIKEGALTRFLRWLMGRAYRRAAKVVVLDEDMRDFLRSAYGVDSIVMGPFPPEVKWAQATAKEKHQVKRWLYSGNFGRAHEIDVLLRVQKMLEENLVEVDLVLQGQGAQFASSQQTAEPLGLRRVRWNPPAAQEVLGESLLQADVLVVTRKPEIKGLLLPSKLMLAELSGRSILWIGDTDGKTAQALKQSGRHGVFSQDQVEPMADWLGEVFAQKPAAFSVEPQATRTLREETVAKWDALIRGELRP